MAPQGGNHLAFHAPEPLLPCVSALRNLPLGGNTSHGHEISCGGDREAGGSGDDGDGGGLGMETKTAKGKENGSVGVGVVILSLILALIWSVCGGDGDGGDLDGGGGFLLWGNGTGVKESRDVSELGMRSASENGIETGIGCGERQLWRRWKFSVRLQAQLEDYAHGGCH